VSILPPALEGEFYVGGVFMPTAPEGEFFKVVCETQTMAAVYGIGEVVCKIDYLWDTNNGRGGAAGCGQCDKCQLMAMITNNSGAKVIIFVLNW
jgi:hypothetical protein